MLAKLDELLRAQVDVASIVVFRVVYGLVILGLSLGLLVSGAVDSHARTCDIELHWRGLEWIALPCDPTALKLFVGLIALAAFGVTVGAFYRASAVLLEILLVLALLADQALYSSTYYLVCLYGFWLIFAPADRAWSIDSRRRGRPKQGFGPAWPLMMIGFHTFVMYTYAAVAKLDGDWLGGLPLEHWLSQKAGLPLVGPLLQAPALPVLFAWGGLLFDALIVPAVLWRPTRAPALVMVFAFHLFNGVVLDVFPLPIIGVVATLTLLPADWPRRLAARSKRREHVAAGPRPHLPISAWHRAALSLWVGLHLLIPLRHHLYPGPVGWNEDGEEFAWRLRARTKVKVLMVSVVDLDTGQRRYVKLNERLNRLQHEAVHTYPDRLLQFAHQLQRAAEEEGEGRHVAVHVGYFVVFNGRQPAALVSRELDLATQPRTFLNTAWIEAPSDE